VSRQAGQLLRSWRNSRGLTQGALAKKVGRLSQSISQYETGVTAPEPDIARALDAALDAGGEILRVYGVNPMPAADEMWQAIETLADLVNAGLDRLELRIARLEQERPPDAQALPRGQ
jgi:transcriptional regulator with XRE-family HTH domain